MGEIGQTAKHEWRENTWSIDDSFTCDHCPAHYEIIGGIKFYYIGSQKVMEEPPCITRKIQADEKQGN